MNMKEVTKTITVFEALDGTHFDKKENCERYEDLLMCVEFFKVSYNPDLTETGNFSSHTYFAVYSRFGYNKAILEQYLRKVMDWDMIGPSVMGCGLQLHYYITDINRSEINTKNLTVLSPVELEWFPQNKSHYFDYMKEWGLK
jgi:hypothetical protein